VQGLADPVRLDHFIAAQDNGVYEQALEELRDGEKRSHWMWFIFPQIAGLGTSATAKKYALPNLAAARAYAGHDVLGDRLYEATEAMLDWAGTMRADKILGSVDAMKFRSSMTLFEAACSDNEPFAQALEAFYDGTRDEETLKRL
jgi:uncharacterized protein (DUF1810 family)